MKILEYIGIGATLVLIVSIILIILILTIQKSFPNRTQPLNKPKKVLEITTVYSLVLFIIFMIITGAYQIIKNII